MEYNPKPLTTVAEQRAEDENRGTRYVGMRATMNLSGNTIGQLMRDAYVAGMNAAREEAVEDGSVTALRLTVWEALDNLAENITDQEMRERTVAHEAEELASYCAPLELFGTYDQLDKLMPHIRSWRRMVKGWEE